MVSARLDRATLAVEWLRANDDFHAAIVRAAGAPILARLLELVRSQFSGQALWSTHGTGTALRRIVDPGLAEHRLVRETMATGAAEAARRIMERHVIGAGEIVTELLREVGPNRQTGSQTAAVAQASHTSRSRRDPKLKRFAHLILRTAH